MSELARFLQLVELSRTMIIEQNLMIDNVIEETAQEDGYIYVPVVWLRKLQDVLSQQTQMNVSSAKLVQAIVDAMEDGDDSDE